MEREHGNTDIRRIARAGAAPAGPRLPLCKVDAPRPIDRVIDYFGGLLAEPLGRRRPRRRRRTGWAT
jgi:hypothetical protein